MGVQAGGGISVSVLGVCEGGNYLMARTCRTLLGGNHALHVVASLPPSTSLLLEAA